MPTKTDRILSYLPATFRALPRPTALYAVTDAFGNELLLSENSLAEVMRAHWVDHADRGAELIQDLACLAALYGLAPRGAEPQRQPADRPATCPPSPADESIEEFREHLKRYVRTFLEGTVTVQGILRVVAEALGLRIADAYAEMDTWWTRSDDGLVTVEPRGDDAAGLLFGVEAVTVTGRPGRPARVVGSVDLSGGADLRGASVLRLKVDAAAPVEVDLAPPLANPAAATLDEIVAALNAALAAPVAGHDGRYLALAAPTVGPAGRLEVQDVAGDAAPQLLGLLPRLYHGAEATSARVTGPIDLSGGADLSDARYLRLVVDGAHLAEVDCAGANPAATTLDEIVAAINAALGLAVASYDGRFLTFTSPATGFTSSIAFQPPAAQDATGRLFGPIAPFHTGRDARPAEVVGGRDLSQGVDLSARSKVCLRVDAGPPVTVDCAGADPARTRPAEIVAALNAALDPGLAAHDGRFVRLTSPTAGPAGTIALEPLPADVDATELIFGIGPRTFQGAAATRARLVGAPDLSASVDLGARHVIQVALDGGPPAEVDVRAGLANPRAATLDEMVAAINAGLGPGVAGHDGQHLSLTSPTAGAAGRVALEPLAVTRRRRFVTRAFVTDEAAQAIFSFVRYQAQGAPATPARVIGIVDLSRGVDLRETRFLRVGVDGQPAREVDFASVPDIIPRPRAAMLDEIVAAINDVLGPGLAAHDGRRLVLTSPTAGAGSRLAFEPPRAADALDTLLGHEPGTFRGRDATRVSFVGTVDLSAGVDLSAADQVKIGVDGADPVEIACAGADPAHTTLNEIVMAINVALGAVIARHDGARLILTSPSTGAGSRLDFAVPAGPDATKVIFGLMPPRSYHGEDAAPAQVVGTPDLHAGADLSLAHFLRLSVDGRQVDVDCAGGAADLAHTTLDEIVAAIAAALGPTGAATHDGTRLAIASTASGQTVRIDLLPYTAGDARAKLLGDVPEVTTGEDPAPATITGQADLLTPVNLAGRRTLRLAVDGGRPVDIDVAGAAPETTFLDEIVARINPVFPGLASATEDDRLRLTSPTAGEGSRLELLPPRTLELIEYPPETVEEPPAAVRHGDRWFVDNDGAAESDLVVELYTPHGVAGPALVNRTTGQRVRLMVVIRPGERVRLWRDPETGLRAAIIAADGTPQPVPGARILAGLLGAQAWLPFAGEWQLSGGQAENPATLQLNNPLAPAVVVLRARRSSPEGNRIAVRVTEAGLTPPPPLSLGKAGQEGKLVGRVRAEAAGYRLVDAAEATLARLRARPGIALDLHRDRVVAVYGPLHPAGGEPPLMLVERLADLFDVMLRFTPDDGEAVEEPYLGVTIGVPNSPFALRHSLVWQINAGPHFSQLVKAEELDKAAALRLSRGRSEWAFLDCYGARFNRDRFNAARFANGLCLERGVFNVSRFARTPPEPEAAVFAPAGPLSDPLLELRLCWTRYRPGAFIVNLPADLPEQFGGRFNQARFGRADDKPEEYKEVVTEPENDTRFLVKLINEGLESDEEKIEPSTLVVARVVPRVPIGWQAVTIPFRHPRTQTLAGGREGEPARLYLAERDVPGFIELRAHRPGAWGNAIAVTARRAGPARFDVTIGYQGARFENARQVALAGRILKPGEEPLPALVKDLLKPGPVGVLQARAAGVRAEVTRDRAESTC